MSAIPPLPAGPVFASRYEPGSSSAFSIGSAISLGWAAMTSQYGPLLAVTVIFLLIQVGASLVGAVIPGASLITGVFLAPLTVSLAYIYVRAVRGSKVEVADLFGHLKVNYWNLVLLQLILVGISIVVLIPVGILIAAALLLGAAVDSVAGVVGAVVVGVVAVLALAYVGVRLGYGGLLYLDAPPGSLEVIDALRLSWRRTAPYALPLIAMAILLGFIVMASGLLLCVGAILLGMPLALAVNAAAYDLICPTPDSGRCDKCGYDCRAVVTGVCPECGAPLTPSAPATAAGAPPANA